MKYIDLNNILCRIFADKDGKNARIRLHRAHKKNAKMQPKKRKAHIDRNGSNKWKPIKDRLTRILGKKCWYTEVVITGAHLVIDHYRPVCNYWFLAYDPENYRVSCSLANSAEHNDTHNCIGGKGDNFPLLPPSLKATGKNKLRFELPVILDPCKAKDCRLLAFQADGRPVIHPDFVGDATATSRVNASKILLNLDHPEFNSLREQLCRKIAEDVRIHEALPLDSAERVTIRNRIRDRLAPNAQFSTAARFYLKIHRTLDWVEDILNST